MSARASNWAWIWLAICIAHCAVALDRILAEASTVSVLGNLGLATIALILSAISAEGRRRWPNE